MTEQVPVICGKLFYHFRGARLTQQTAIHNTTHTLALTTSMGKTYIKWIHASDRDFSTFESSFAPLSFSRLSDHRLSINIYITCDLADTFIQSDLQLIRLSRRHTPWSNVGLRAMLMSSSLTTMLQAAQYLRQTEAGSLDRGCIRLILRIH